MATLTELSIKYNTDKNPNDHNYISLYEQWFGRSNVQSMLEIGLGSGASHRMWLEYFPQAKIYGIEYFDEENKNTWNNFDGNIPGLNLIRGSSTDPETWNQIPYGLDIIIDDGSHEIDDQIKTFELGFSKLRQGGLWIIEDCHCGFEKKYGASDKLYRYFMNLIIGQQIPNLPTGGDFYKYRQYMSGFSRDIFSYSFYKSLIVMTKA